MSFFETVGKGISTGFKKYQKARTEYETGREQRASQELRRLKVQAQSERQRAEIRKYRQQAQPQQGSYWGATPTPQQPTPATVVKKKVRRRKGKRKVSSKGKRRVVLYV